MIRQRDGRSWCARPSTYLSLMGAVTLGLFVYHIDETLEAQERGFGCVGVKGSEDVMVLGKYRGSGGQKIKDRPHHSFRFAYDYLLPSFSNTRGPCSSHSCLEIHMSSLSAICCLH